jgi:hypothetical protein
MDIVCTRCRKPYVQADRCRGVLNHLLRWAYLYPYRCQVCRRRFYVMQWGFRPAEAPADLAQDRSRPVQIHATLVEERGERDGTITDLSGVGCALETMPPLLEGAILGIRLHALDDNPPIVVEAAIVRSSLGSRVEVEFLRVAKQEAERLNQFLLNLWIDGTQIARSSGR